MSNGGALLYIREELESECHLFYCSWGVDILDEVQYFQTILLHSFTFDEYSYITNFINLDDGNLLCSSNNMKGYATHYLLNKKSGQAELVDSIPNGRYISEYIFAEKDGVTYSTAPSLAPFVRTSNGIVYADHSNDTLYRITDNMTPTIGYSCQASKWLTISARMKECIGRVTVWRKQAERSSN